MALKGGCLCDNRERLGAYICLFEARGEFFREFPEERREFAPHIGAVDVNGGGLLDGMAFCPGALAPHLGTAKPPRAVVDSLSGTWAQNALQDIAGCRGGFAYRVNAEAEQFFGTPTADSEESANRQRVKFFRQFLGPERVDFIRLLKVARHLGEKLIFADADIDREAEGLPDFCLNGRRTGANRGFFLPAVRETLTHIEKGFINRELFDRGTVATQNFEKGCGATPVIGEVCGDQHKPGTGTAGATHGLAAVYAKALGGNRGGCHDAVARGDIARDGRGNGSEVNAVRILFEPLECAPGQKRRVHINMKNNAGQARPPFEN